jgi:hypothetical protein
MEIEFKGIKEIKISRHTLAASAATGCEGCVIIYEARKATTSRAAFYTDYVYVREEDPGAPLLVSGLNQGAHYKEWG